MRNVTCVTTTLLSLTGDRKKLIKQNTLSRYFGVHHLQRKGKWSRSRRKKFFLKSGAKMGHGSKRMIRCQTTCTAHTLENCPKSADSNVPLVRYWNAPWSSCYSFIKEKWSKKQSPLWNWVSFISSDVTSGAMCGVRTKHHLLVLTRVTH